MKSTSFFPNLLPARWTSGTQTSPKPIEAKPKRASSCGAFSTRSTYFR